MAGWTHEPVALSCNCLGSSIDKKGASSGYVILKGKGDVLHTQSISLTGHASIFQAELIAIQEAAEHLTVNKDTLSSFQTHKQPYRL